MRRNPMYWTKDKPTKPGYYRFRGPGIETIGKVIESATDPGLIIFWIGSINDSLVEDEDGEWSSEPLPECEEKGQDEIREITERLDTISTEVYGRLDHIEEVLQI